ncbi:MDR/zinc-dependent alcohol dehydrogenase-like family protein [Dickeya zeae]|uniref:hypothetical protein n=1 Tax=Dickeya zeae TaxID=204042 RepID=UPI002098487B|nr:hypothetical protein [Dickeya zeae]MCO7262343.1 hypothetical protein [Dickeya zeae]
MKSWEQGCTESASATFSYNSSVRRDGSVTYGGYSESIIASHKFVLTRPYGLAPVDVAPLLCAGITTWSPLHRWNIGKGSKVAVFRLGGLGHMALKLSKVQGAGVTLFTQSAGKENDVFHPLRP